MDFANPLFMAAGGALVSAPILIHLINRMRFKRIRWAAMEFLLKSQKRNRRRLIIEQLILLALRCLLVMLAGFLLARFRLSRDTGQNAFHLAILDDTPSMGDRFNRNGAATDAFEVGKNQILELGKSLSEAQNGQRLRLALLSHLDNPIFDAKIDAISLGELETRLDRPETKLSFCTSSRSWPWKRPSRSLKRSGHGTFVKTGRAAKSICTSSATSARAIGKDTPK